jgi:hypothetical protein
LRRALLALVVVGLAVGTALGWSGNAKAVAFTATPTTTTLAISPSSIALDGTYTLTATVVGTTVPQGSVTFWSGSTQVGGGAVQLTPVQGSSTTATATVTVQNEFPGGSYPLTATYKSGDIFTWSGSTSQNAVTLTVAGAVTRNSTTVLTVSPSSVTEGDAVTLTAVVSRDDSVLPTGIVTFRDGGTLVGTANIVGSASVVNGVATITRSDFLAGTHTFTASYVGPITDPSSPNYVAASHGSATLIVNAPATPSVVDTTTTVVSIPGTIRAGDTVTLRAHVVQTGRASTPPGGPIVTFRDVTTSPATYLGEAQLDANGNAEITVSGWTTGTYQIRAEYFGDLLDRPSNGEVTLSVLPGDSSETFETDLAVDPVTATPTTKPTLSAVLTADGSAVGGETVTLAAAGQTCTATTGDDGVARCTLPATVAPGTYTVTASYDGSDTYDPSSGTSTLVVTKASTTLTVPALTVVSGGSATLAATLTAGSAPVAGRSVTLTAGTQSCTAITTSTGLASCTITFNQLPGSYALNASFDGDATYAAATGAGTLTATGKATTLFVLPSIAVYGHTAILSARLTDANGTALATQPVTLSVGSRSCTDLTNWLGVALCTITVDTAPGTAPIVGTFGGAIGYVGSTGSSTIVIAKQPTTLKVTSSLVQQSGTVTVTAKLTDADGDPIAGAPVVLTLGSSSQTATTNAAGIATATFSGRGAGSYAVSARYGGDDYYVASTSSAGTKLICYDDSRFLVWGGNQSDLDDAVGIGDHFTFWGAQWSKQVVRGDYAGGSSLKGWADKVSGSTWSTAPGNSSSAPKSVASYISVIVTTKVTKSGSTLSGNAVRRVVIRVDDPDRYDANPGHAAAGTVVAIL